MPSSELSPLPLPASPSTLPSAPPPPARELDESERDAYAALGSAVRLEAAFEWSAFGGAQAAATLNGLVTNDVSALAIGDAQLAAVLSPKGKVISDLVVIRESAERFLVAAPAAGAAGWMGIARKYINPRFCTVTDESGRYRTAIVVGTDADRALTDRDRSAGTFEHWRAPVLGTTPASLMRWEAAFDDEVRAWCVAAGLTDGSAALLDVIRVESGVPAWGRDMDENTLPQEANLGTLGAISFTKGCYTGQETVARIHFRGHVNRHLRGLVASSPLTVGAVVDDAAGKMVGEVRSAVISPRFGSIALAMIRREVPIDSMVLVAEGASTPTEARVVALPFSQ